MEIQTYREKRREDGYKYKKTYQRGKNSQEMQAICEACGKEVKDNKTHCKTCLVVFCNDDCLKKENKKHCVPPDSKLVYDTLSTFGITKDGKGLPSYNGRSIIVLPGPIKGEIPRGMRSAESEEGKKVIATWTKGRKGPLSLPGAQPYYLVDIADLARVFFVQLTTDQRNEMATIKDAQLMEVQKHANLSKK